MKNIALSLCLLSLLIAACATPPPQHSRDEWLNLTQRTFKNTSVDKVLQAGEAVLKLADPSDVSIRHAQNSLTATRTAFVYAVFAFTMANYYFDATATQRGNDVDLRLGIEQSFGSLGMSTGRTSVQYSEPYNLFYARIESLLYNKPWISCSRAIDEVYKCQSQALEALCFLADDNVPPTTGSPH